MQIRVTKSDDFSWHRWHVGETFTVNRTITHTGGGKSYEVDLIDRHPDSFAGLISADDCEVVDWTDAPPSMEIERLRSQLAALTAERDALAARLAKVNTRTFDDLVAENDRLRERVIAQGTIDSWLADIRLLTAERDDLAAKLAEAQAKLHELRIRLGQTA